MKSMTKNMQVLAAVAVIGLCANAQGDAAAFKLKKVVKSAGKAIGSAGKSAVAKAKAAFRAASLFTTKELATLRKDAGKAWGVVEGGVLDGLASAKTAFKAMSGALEEKIKAELAKHESTLEAIGKPFFALLDDAAEQPRLKRLVSAILRKRFDRQFKEDLMHVGQRLGRKVKLAGKGGRRDAAAMCSTDSTILSAWGLSVGIGVDVAIGASASGGVFVNESGMASNVGTLGTRTKSLGAAIGAGIDICYHHNLTAENARGYSTGWSASGKLVVSGTYALDYPSSKRDWDTWKMNGFKNGIPAVTICGGVGLGGGWKINWSQTSVKNAGLL